MTVTPNNSNACPRFIDLSVGEFVRQVADPAVSAGGGVVAATTLAGAAASAELVLRLAARRKSLSSRRDEIETLLGLVERHRAFFEGSPDRDIAAFTALVATQREARGLRDSEPSRAESMLQDAYVHAADVPLELSRQALTFMNEVEQGLEFASKFTISDLGAAAVLARGAIDAALLTVDANLAYVSDDRATTRAGEVVRIRAQAWEIADRVLTKATAVITGTPSEGKS